MALNINGTTGISGVDGSASAPAVTGTDSNTGINFGSDTVNINTGGSTRATIDSSGDYLFLGGTLRIKDSGNSAQRGAIYGDATSFHLNGGSPNLLLYSGGGERMRIDSSGNIGIGTSNPSGLGNGISILPFNEHGTSKVIFNRSSVSNNVTVIAFLNGGSTAGSIGMNASSVSFNTSSDYRLKENVTVISDGITRLKTLKPSRFNFIADATKTVDGFLAHEVTAVPEAITGTKDEVDSDNNPVYQGIDQSKLVPLLTAALQEAIAKIEVLETKVAALEAA